MAQLALLPRPRNVSSPEHRERERVKRHILGAELEARSRELDGLTAEQRTVRALLLEELSLYREAGVFPANPDFDVPMPYFIDARGVRCAMAHLMEIGGAAELVQEIARTRNNAFVAELAADPRVVAWLDAAGLSPEEAARIQPTYCPAKANSCVCYKAGEAKLVLKGTASGEGYQHRLTVAEIAGAGEGACAEIQVGDEVELSTARGVRPGAVATAVARERSGSDGGSDCVVELVYAAIDGEPTCDNGLAETALPEHLTAVEALAALGAEDCVGHLNARSSAWDAQPANACADDDASPFGPGCGAAGAHPGAAGLTTMAVLGALLAFRAARSLRRARPTGPPS